MAQARNPNVGRHFQNAPTGIKGTIAAPGTTAHMSNNRASATSGRGLGTSPKSLGTSAQNQTRDSGGGTFNTIQSARSNVASLNVPQTGPAAGKQQLGYPDMNVGAVNTPVNAPGGGKVTKKVAGIAKFYGR